MGIMNVVIRVPHLSQTLLTEKRYLKISQQNPDHDRI